MIKIRKNASYWYRGSKFRRREVKSYFIYDWVNYYDEAVDEMIEGRS